MTRRERQRRRKRRNGRPLRRVSIVLGTLLLAGLVGAGIVAAGWVASVVQATPNLDTLKPKPLGSVSTVYAADGTRLGFIAADNLRHPVSGRAIPLVVKRATVAIEDRRFYHHGGVDYVGILRAAVKNVTSKRTAQGGSTLTMQLVRNLYTPTDRQKTLKRKIREAKLADQLEQEHSKEWILDSYLNNVPYGTVGGQTAWGIDAAARIFFDEPATALTLPQAALLAGLPQAPSDYNPFSNPTGARERRDEVLRAMTSAGDITQAEADAATATPLGVRHSNYFSRRRERFFFDYVKSELIHRYGLKTVRQGGLKVYTTIDLEFQQLARKSITDHLNQPGQPAAALATIDPRNGHILAMASSATYGQTVFNYATQSHRQPGSTFKVIDLMAALRMGIDPDTTSYVSRDLQPGWLPSEPTWHVQTDSHSYAGSISLTAALAASDNTVFAQLGVDISPEKIRQAAYDLGITSHLDAYPAEAIGGLTRGVSPLEMANAYATVSDGGWRNTATAITKVVHPDGSVDDLGKPQRKKEFTDGETAKAIKAMKGVIDHGTGYGLAIGCPAAGKTGTTSDSTDVWFVGVTPHLSTAVWVGYPNENRSMSYGVPGYGGEIFGATIPGPIWQEFMQTAKGSACDDWPAPKQAFESVPFFGHYASLKPVKDPNADTKDGKQPKDPKNLKPGDKGYDPNAYAHPPQKPPKTGGRGGDSHGGGKPPVGAGGGGAGPPPA